MAQSKIEWLAEFDADGTIIRNGFTFNSWRGCMKVSDGCKFCYAETMSLRNPKVLGEWGPKGLRALAAEAYWKLPIKWNADAEQEGRRARVFASSLSDVFEENAQVIESRARLFNLIFKTPHLDWLVLTKRPQNIKPMLQAITSSDERYSAWDVLNRGYLSNIVWGTSVEDQATADQRVPVLTKVPGRHFLSMEPLLGPVEMKSRMFDLRSKQIDWVIAGGESGPHARPPHPDWFRTIRDQCVSTDTPFFFKQWGEWATSDHPALSNVWQHVGDDGFAMKRVGKHAAGRVLDGQTWSQFYREAA